VRVGDAGLNERAGDGGSGWQAGCIGSDKRCGVGRSGGWGMQGTWGEGAWGCTWLGWLVGPLGPGDGPLVHHPM
jgi:hypothetical protein